MPDKIIQTFVDMCNGIFYQKLIKRMCIYINNSKLSIKQRKCTYTKTDTLFAFSVENFIP